MQDLRGFNKGIGMGGYQEKYSRYRSRDFNYTQKQEDFKKETFEDFSRPIEFKRRNLDIEIKKVNVDSILNKYAGHTGRNIMSSTSINPEISKKYYTEKETTGNTIFLKYLFIDRIRRLKLFASKGKFLWIRSGFKT